MLSKRVNRRVSVAYTTRDGTAEADSDYLEASGRLGRPEGLDPIAVGLDQVRFVDSFHLYICFGDGRVQYGCDRIKRRNLNSLNSRYLPFKILGKA